MMFDEFWAKQTFQDFPATATVEAMARAVWKAAQEAMKERAGWCAFSATRIMSPMQRTLMSERIRALLVE